MAPSTTPEDRKNASLALILAIAGCVAGGLITNALTSSSTVRIAGTVLGSAVPPLIQNKGPWHRLRASLAIFVTVVALIGGYGGFAVFAAASQTSPAVPLPSKLDPTHDDEASGPAIDVSPSTVHCGTRTSGEPGGPFPCPAVIVESTGDAALIVTRIDGDPLHQFTHDQNCVRRSPLAKGATCELWISMKSSGGSGQHSARIVIHENIKTDNGFAVTVEGELRQPPPFGDLSIAADSLACAYAASELVDGEYKPVVKISFEVALADQTSEIAPTDVFVAAKDVTEGEVLKLADTKVDVPVGHVDQSRPLLIPLSPENYGRSAALALTVDPDRTLAESTTANNTFNMKVALPDQGQPDGPLQCDAT